MRQIAPRHVERRRPEQHAAAADAPLEHRRRAGIEPRQHLRILRRRHVAIAVDRHGREVAAARRAERLEHRMAVLERADARRRRRASDRPGCRSCAGSRSTSCGQRRARPGGDEQPAALLDELREPPRQRRRSRPRRSAPRPRCAAGPRRDSASGWRDDRLESRRLADRQRARQIQAASALPRSTIVSAPARTATRRS